MNLIFPSNFNIQVSVVSHSSLLAYFLFKKNSWQYVHAHMRVTERRQEASTVSGHIMISSSVLQPSDLEHSQALGVYRANWEVIQTAFAMWDLAYLEQHNYYWP